MSTSKANVKCQRQMWNFNVKCERQCEMSTSKVKWNVNFKSKYEMSTLKGNVKCQRQMSMSKANIKCQCQKQKWN